MVRCFMKRFFISAFFFAISLYASAQIKVCCYYDGYWSEWEEAYLSDLYGRLDPTIPYLKIYGNYSGFCTYGNTAHPSTYSFKFQITNYTIPDKKTKKEHLKKGKWYEYSGTVEYYVKEDLPTIKDILKRESIFGHFPSITPSYGTRKRSVNATIQIAPYKDHPRVYNIWFEGVGVGIDIGTIYFPE